MARFNVGMMRSALKKSGGNVTDAAKILDCSVFTIYYYLRKYKSLADLRKELVEATLDLAEDAMINKIKQGHWPAIRYYLSTKGKQRGYTERSEVVNSGKLEIEISRVDDY